MGVECINRYVFTRREDHMSQPKYKSLIEKLQKDIAAASSAPDRESAEKILSGSAFYVIVKLHANDSKESKQELIDELCDLLDVY